MFSSIFYRRTFFFSYCTCLNTDTMVDEMEEIILHLWDLLFYQKKIEATNSQLDSLEECLSEIVTTSGLAQAPATALEEQAPVIPSQGSSESQEEQDVQAVKRFRESAAEGECMICFEDGPNIITACCGKAVHLNCLAEWLATKNTCPHCRRCFCTTIH